MLSIVARHEVEARGGCFALGEPGATDLVLADLRDRGADHTAERRRTAGCVHAGNPALLVRVRAERDEHGRDR